MSELQQGDKVTWSSQAKGHHKKKVGRVVYVPTPKSPPPWFVAREMFSGHKQMFDGNRFRKRSVLIEVESEGNAKPRLYMPWPNTVQKVSDGET